MTDKEKLELLKKHRGDLRFLKGEVGDWIIEQCEKVERYEEALKEIANYDDRDVQHYNSTYEFYQLRNIAVKALK